MEIEQYAAKTYSREFVLKEIKNNKDSYEFCKDDLESDPEQYRINILFWERVRDIQNRAA